MSNIILYDLARAAYKKNIPFLPKIISRLTRVIYSCEIPYTADIDKNVCFSHKGLGVVIGHDAVIGKGTKVLQNVTIGGRGAQNGNPIIGENVLIGSGACVLGKIIIGNNVKIGAGAVVLSDVPEGETVVGIPAKTIKKPK